MVALAKTNFLKRKKTQESYLKHPLLDFYFKLLSKQVGGMAIDPFTVGIAS